MTSVVNEKLFGIHESKLFFAFERDPEINSEDREYASNIFQALFYAKRMNFEDPVILKRTGEIQNHPPQWNGRVLSKEDIETEKKQFLNTRTSLPGGEKVRKEIFEAINRAVGPICYENEQMLMQTLLSLFVEIAQHCPDLPVPDAAKEEALIYLK